MSMLIMSLSIILILCSEVELQHSDNPTILFRFQEKYRTDLIVERYRPLDIVLDNFFAQYAWCLNFNYTGPDDVFIKHTTFEGNSDSIMSVPKVKDNMLTKWWCVVLQKYKDGKPYSYLGRNYTAQNIVFVLRESEMSNNTLVYCMSAVGVVIIIILMIILYLSVKKRCCCIRSSSQELPPVPTPRPDPETVFYLNLLSVFRPINEREAAEMENHYEEIQ